MSAIIPQPLAQTKMLKPNMSTSTLKREAAGPSDQVFKKSKPTVPVRPYRPMTPASSSPTRPIHDLPDAYGFKMPALPRQTDAPLTPSTSTVAFSSSPRRHVDSSSPIPDAKVVKLASHREARSVSREVEQVRLVVGTTLVFGRHRHRASRQSSSASLATVIPKERLANLDEQYNRATIIHLSRHASHASRIHAAIEYNPRTASARVLVLGQNGVRVRRDSGKTTSRIKQGEYIDVSAEEGLFIMDFYGCTITVDFPLPREEDFGHQLFSDAESDSGISEAPSPLGSSMPPSSPPMAPMELDEEDDESDANPASSPIPLSKVDLPEVVESKPLRLVFTAPPSTPAPSDPIPLRPESIDLPALLASTVVFSGSSKLSLPDLVKGMLEVGSRIAQS
jgi:hypothetical protein